MLNAGEDELVCDFAETYHILDLRALPVPRLPGVGCREGVAPGDCPPDRPVRL